MKINEVINENFNDRLPFLEKLTPLAPKTTPIGKLNLTPDTVTVDRLKKNKNDQSDVFTGDEIKITTYIGPNATDWNNKAFLKAQKLHKQGKNEADIWKETRTVLDADGNWWQEISDHASTLKKVKPVDWDETGLTTLGQVLDAPGLFNSYPYLRDLPVWHDKDASVGQHVSGWYLDGKIGMRFMPNFDPLNATERNLQELKGTLYHEIFHAIDDIEGRSVAPATGYRGHVLSDITFTPKRDVYTGSSDEVKARDVTDRLNMTPNERGKHTPRVLGRAGRDGGSRRTIVVKDPDIDYGDKPGSTYDIIDNPNYKKWPYDTHNRK